MEDAGRGHLSSLVLSALESKLSLSCTKGSKTSRWEVVNGEACFRAGVLYLGNKVSATKSQLCSLEYSKTFISPVSTVLWVQYVVNLAYCSDL